MRLCIPWRCGCISEQSVGLSAKHKPHDTPPLMFLQFGAGVPSMARNRSGGDALPAPIARAPCVPIVVAEDGVLSRRI